MVRPAVVAAVVGVACLASTPAPLPTPVPAMRAAATPADDPVGVLADALTRFRGSVRGYTATLHKQERTGGTLHPPEVVRVAVREEPYAILMRWTSGARGPLGTPVEGSLFVAGVNAGRMTVWRPAARLAPLRQMTVDPTDTAARAASRYAITEAGLGHALERTRRSWAAAKQAGTLQAEHLGRKRVPELDRECVVLRRTSATPQLDPFQAGDPAPDPARRPADAFTTVTVMLDPDTGAQLGSVLTRADGESVGRYFFRDFVANPTFPADQFTPAALRR
jgi:hypothetical protein